MISSDSRLDHVTPYDRFAASDVQIESWLARGEHSRELIAYFGASEYRALAALARRSEKTRVADEALEVLIVPGIMGSQLGLARRPPLPNDIVWLDPIDIERGRLAVLRLPGAAQVVPLGAVLYSYLRLKLYLRAHGFAAQLYDYDWRLSVGELGAALAARLRAAAGRKVAIVAHSMGGLVARAALALPGTDKVERVVFLGTPHHGSFAAVQALRGTYAVVRKVARLAVRDSAESLAQEVFSTFPSLYDLLPSGDGSSADLFDADMWPSSAPQPHRDLMQAARAARERLAQPDERFLSIVGVGQETVTAITRSNDEFIYTLTRHGDGTVPVTSAVLGASRTAYASVAHSDLTRDPAVAAAVVDMLSRGVTRRLPGEWVSRSRASARVSDAQLRRSHLHKVDFAALSPTERRLFLQNLNEPPRLKLRAPARARPKRPRHRRGRRSRPGA